MKISHSKTNDRLFLVARFEQFKLCDFSLDVTDSLNALDYAKRMSAGDPGTNRFYVLRRVTCTGVACCWAR